MRIGVDLRRDPLNHDALPPVGGMGFDYRTEPKPHARTFEFTLYLFCVILPLSLAITLAARLVSGSLASGFALAVLTALSMGFAIYTFFADDWRLAARDPIRTLLLPMASGPAIWLMAYLASWTNLPVTAATLPLALGLGLTAFLADRFASHFVSWSLAAPRLNAQSRRQWKRLWNSRFDRQLPDPPHDLSASRLSLWHQAVAAVRAYRICMLVLAGAYLACILLAHVLSSGSLFLKMQVGSMCLLLLVFALIRVAKEVPLCPVPLIRQAIVNWFTYNAHDTRAPGVWVSPAGSFRSRVIVSVLALFLLVFSVAPMAMYFPVGLLATGPDVWTKAAYQADWLRRLSGLQDAILPPPISRETILRYLTPDQRYYFDQLASDRGRNEYLDQLADHYRTVGTDESQARSIRANVLRSLSRRPESWLLTALVGSFRGSGTCLFWLLVALVLSVLVPALLFLTILYCATGSALSAFHRIVNADAVDHRAERVTEWECYVSRLREADPVHEKFGSEFDPRDHLWLGTTVLNNYPVFLHRGILHDHAHILGDTGSGKTSLALAPLITQLIRTARPDPQRGHPGHSVVILDLKGEPSLFRGTRIEARAAGLPFKFFTNENGMPTHVFNPFLQKCISELSPNQQSEILLQALGLEHGEGYGASYFSRINRKTLSQTLTAYNSTTEPIVSFLGLNDVFADRLLFNVRDRQRDASEELISTIASLAGFDALNAAPQDVQKRLVPQTALDQAIDMGDVLERPQVTYFYLPAAIETASVREIAKLALYSLLTAAVRHERLHGKPSRVYLVIDEFQQVIAKNLELLLRQARSKGIAMILANQAITDLRTHDGDLAPTVQANTRFRQYFSAGDLTQQKLLVEASGEAMFDLDRSLEPEEPLDDDTATWPADPEGNPIPAGNLKVSSRFSRNDIIRMSDDKMQCLVQVQHGMGFTQFQGFSMLLRCGFHVSSKTFERRKALKWPRPADHTITAPCFPADHHHISGRKAPAGGPSVVIPNQNDDDAQLPTPPQIVLEAYERDAKRPRHPSSSTLPDNDDA